MHLYTKYVNPFLGQRLTEIGMDKRFVRGEGCYLYDDVGRAYLDFIASYGALPFGFNHPRIWQAIVGVQQELAPSFAQPSHLEAAGRLAEALIQAAPANMAYVTFANSGAEAVEAAIKICRARRGRRGIVSATNSFHGKTLGALSATGNDSYQKAFFTPAEGFFKVPFGDSEALEMFLREHHDQLAAVMLEPIQGEGGIIEPPRDYLRRVRELCTAYGVPLVLDEIQTGLGRTGLLFALERDAIEPDVLILAKALSGGIMPIGAVLASDAMYTEEFAMKHSSTFAANSLACAVGLEVMGMLTENDQALIKEVQRLGVVLKDGLSTIAGRYPQVIRAIHGRGFMLGIDVGTDKSMYPHSLLGVLAEQEMLTPLISSYMLNVEQVRVAPTLNGASVIRIEPPLIAGQQEIDRALEAIEATAAVLTRNNTPAFLGHLVGFDAKEKRQPQTVRRAAAEPVPKPGMNRFAFLIHPVKIDNYTDFDKSLREFDREQLRDLSLRWNDMVEPFVVSSTIITGKDGSQAYGEFVCVPRTAHQLQDMAKEQAEAEITAAVDLAVGRGAQIVGLGAYTSVVTGGGRNLLDKVEVALTTGNSYTVLSGVEALMSGAERLGIDLSGATAAVVGAGGAIGKASTVLLGEQVQRLVLLGNPERPAKSRHRMLKIVGEFLRRVKDRSQQGISYHPNSLAAYCAELSGAPDRDANPAAWRQFAEEVVGKTNRFILSVDAEKYLVQADLILSATSTPEAIIEPAMLKWGALICDLSRPSNVSEEVLEQRQDVLLIDGGVIEVPGRPDLGWDFGFDPGLAYACMSETMMMALSGRFENTSIGADLNLDYLQELRELAAAKGFGLAGFRSFDRPIADDVWKRILRLHKKALLASGV